MTLASPVHSHRDRRAGQADLDQTIARRLDSDVPDRGEHHVRHLLVHENGIGWWRVFEEEDHSQGALFRSDRLRAEDHARELLRSDGGGVIRVVDHAGEQLGEYVVQPTPRRVGTPVTRRPRRRWGW